MRAVRLVCMYFAIELLCLFLASGGDISRFNDDIVSVDLHLPLHVGDLGGLLQSVNCVGRSWRRRRKDNI